MTRGRECELRWGRRASRSHAVRPAGSPHRPSPSALGALAVRLRREGDNGWAMSNDRRKRRTQHITYCSLCTVRLQTVHISPEPAYGNQIIKNAGAAEARAGPKSKLKRESSWKARRRTYAESEIRERRSFQVKNERVRPARIARAQGSPIMVGAAAVTRHGPSAPPPAARLHARTSHSTAHRMHDIQVRSPAVSGAPCVWTVVVVVVVSGCG